MTQIEVGLGAVVGDEHLAVLGRHRAGVDVDVGVELQDAHPQASGLEVPPMLAAVMPLPRLLATPPVTKTYFDMGQGSSGVFLMLSETAGRSESDRSDGGFSGRHSGRPEIG